MSIMERIENSKQAIKNADESSKLGNFTEIFTNSIRKRKIFNFSCSLAYVAFLLEILFALLYQSRKAYNVF